MVEGHQNKQNTRNPCFSNNANKSALEPEMGINLEVQEDVRFLVPLPN